MSLHRWLAAPIVILALGGCAQVSAGQGQPPYAPYSAGNNGGRYRDGDNGGERSGI